MKNLFEITKARHSELSAYCIDIGARDVSTSNIKDFMEQDYRCLFVEPNPHQVETIEEELLLYNPKPNAWIAPVAIGSEEGITEFICSPNVGHSRIPNKFFNKNKWQTKGEKKIHVTMWTFQKLLDEHPAFTQADIVDIDTEGYDTVVLRSMFETDLRPRIVMIEDWDDPVILQEQKELFDKHHYVLFSDKINQSKIYYRPI